MQVRFLPTPQTPIEATKVWRQVAYESRICSVVTTEGHLGKNSDTTRRTGLIL